MREPNPIILEQARHQIDYVKHMTTLSTGSILLLTTFLEKLFSKPNWKQLVAISFVGFTISVIASIIIHTMSVFSEDFFKHSNNETANKAAFIVLTIMWLSFLVGVISLTAFSLKNLLS